MKVLKQIRTKISKIKLPTRFTKIVLVTVVLLLLAPIIFSACVTSYEWLINPKECLFGLTSGTCVKNNSVSFSLGEAVAATGLIFTVIQLVKKKHSLTLYLNAKLRVLSYILMVVGLVFILIGFLVSQFEVNLKLVGFQSFWELLGFISLATSPFLYRRAMRKSKKLFRKNSKSAERFYRAVMDVISIGGTEYIEAALGLIYDNRNEIFAAIETYNYSPTKYEGESPRTLTYEEYAIKLLDLVLSEPTVVEYIATKRRDLLQMFMYEVKSRHIRTHRIGRGISKLFEELFENPQSFLYQQLEGGGISEYKPFYSWLFGDPEEFFVASCNALGGWNRYSINPEAKFNPKYVEVFLKAYKKALEAHGFNSENSDVTRALAGGMRKLVDYARDIVFADGGYFNGQISAREDILHKIEYFLDNEFTSIYEKALKAETVSNFELSAQIDEHGTSDSITGNYAVAYVKYLGIIATFEKGSENEGFRARLMSDNLLSVISDKPDLSKIRESVLGLIWLKIEDNVERGFFPAVTRVYFELISFQNPNGPKWYKDERNKFFEYIKHKLVPELDELMADDETTKKQALLPKNMDYDSEIKQIVLTKKNGQKSPLKWKI